jgi:hypothetical protein
MTPAQFKKLALSMPGAEEHAHMGHPDFRLSGKGKIFATLQPDKGLAMVKTSVEQQTALVEQEPDVFVLFGGWSKNGATRIRLENVDPALVKELVREAFALASMAAKPKTRDRKRTTAERKSGAKNLRNR